MEMDSAPRRSWRAGAGVSLLLMAGLVAPASAEMTYSYSGSDFDTLFGVDNPFTTADSVSGFFTVPEPLAADLLDSPISSDVTDFAFSAGTLSFDPVSFPGGVPPIYVSTDEFGSIMSWYVLVDGIDTLPDSTIVRETILTAFDAPGFLGVSDSDVAQTCTLVPPFYDTCDVPTIKQGSNSSDPGRWTFPVGTSLTRTIGWWSVDGDASDLSGYENDGLVDGALLVADPFGASDGAYRFDGVDDSIVLGSDPILKPDLPITIAARVRHECPIGVSCTIFENDADPGTTYAGVTLSLTNANNLYSQFGDGGVASSSSRRNASTASVLPADTWKHLAVVIRGATDFEFYVDGARLDTSDVFYDGTGGPLTYASGEPRIGLGYDRGGAFSGDIDDVRFYDRALSAGGLASFSPCVVDGLRGAWPFGGSAVDATLCGNDGAVTGASLAAGADTQANSAYAFTNATDFIDLGNSPLLKPELPLSISLWLRHECGSALCRVVSGDISTGAPYTGYWLNVANGVLAAGYGDGGAAGSSNRRSVTGTAVIPEDTWTHVVLVIRGPRDFELYIDGVTDALVHGGTGGPIHYDGNPTLLGNTSGLDAPFVGRLDAVRLYDRALSADEVVALPEPGFAGAILGAATTLVGLARRRTARRCPPSHERMN